MWNDGYAIETLYLAAMNRIVKLAFVYFSSSIMFDFQLWMCDVLDGWLIDMRASRNQSNIMNGVKIIRFEWRTYINYRFKRT